jgi:hypothetical protein
MMKPIRAIAAWTPVSSVGQALALRAAVRSSGGAM